MGWLGQRAMSSLVTGVSRTQLARRTEALPAGGPDHAKHLTSVLRVPVEFDLPTPLPPGHYRYPPDTVHVTVCNLDLARRSTEDAIERLKVQGLQEVRFFIDGLGCSSDTIYAHCLYDKSFTVLRRAVRAAFDVEPSWSVRRQPYRVMAFANLVRFDGPGVWPGRLKIARWVDVRAMEIVRTDRYLSGLGTTVIAAVQLGAPARPDGEPPRGRR